MRRTTLQDALAKVDAETNLALAEHLLGEPAALLGADLKAGAGAERQAQALTAGRGSSHAAPQIPRRLRLSLIPSICALIPHTDFGVCPGEIRLKPPVAFEDKVQKCLCPWRLTGKEL